MILKYKIKYPERTLIIMIMRMIRLTEEITQETAIVAVTDVARALAEWIDPDEWIDPGDSAVAQFQAALLSEDGAAARRLAAEMCIDYAGVQPTTRG
jgi:hypothetical protein